MATTKTYLSVTKITPLELLDDSTHLIGPFDTDEAALKAMDEEVSDAEKKLKYYDDVQEVTVTSHQGDGAPSKRIVAGFRDEGGYAAFTTVVSYYFQIVYVGGSYRLSKEIADTMDDVRKLADAVRERMEMDAEFPQFHKYTEQLDKLATGLTNAADEVASLMQMDDPYALR